MKRILVALCALTLFSSGKVWAQTDTLAVADSVNLVPEGFEYKDSLVYVPVSRMTDSLRGRDVFEVLSGSGVVVRQSPELASAVGDRIDANYANTLETEGYRIRIFFDNRQDAREASELAVRRFEKLFPGYQTYRTFIYPNFKVTVGDFRTKAEAQVALKNIVRVFPNAFVVKERMKFPVVSQVEKYSVDTIKVLVPIEVVEPLKEESK